MDASTSRKSRSPLRVVLTAAAVLVGVVVVGLALIQTRLLPALFRSPRPVLSKASERDARWQQDVRYFSQELPRLHANAFYAADQEAWRARAAALEQNVPDLTDEEILFELIRLTALIGDGHTRLRVRDIPGFTPYPISLRWFPDGLYVAAAADPYREALGGRVVKIEDTPIEEAYDAVVPLVSTDNEMGLVTETPGLLATPAVLHVLGIAESAESVRYTLEDQAGEQFEITVEAQEGDTIELVSLADTAGGLDEPPLYARHRDLFYWYEYLPEARTVFVQYNQCAEMEEQSFEDFTAEVFATIDANPVDRIVVDFRYNGGGNSAIFAPFLRELEARPALAEEGHLFGLIGRNTFSSGMWNALDIRNAGGLLIGEPTGGRPNAYGETRSFALPNSGIRVQYSTRYWQILEDSDPPSVLPDVEVEPGILDVAAGQDVVLDAAISYEP